MLPWKTQRSGYLLQNFALFVNLQGETPPPGEGAGAEDLYRLSMGCRAGSPLEEVLTLADLYWTEMEANEDLAVPVRSFQEMERARQAGKGLPAADRGGGGRLPGVPSAAADPLPAGGADAHPHLELSQ